MRPPLSGSRSIPSKQQLTATTTPIGATIEPATQGTTYGAAAGAGASLYAFSVPESYEGNVDNVPSVNSYVNQVGGTEVPETVAWSPVRHITLSRQS
ncbi:MAG TPA: hypothetical protein VGI44_08330 [Acidimicrobiales bacterium]